MAIKPGTILLVLLGACGGDGSNGDGNEVRVEIHRGYPFVDGDTADDATFVAVQDGDGAFVPATGVKGVYTVPIASDRFGVAVGCNDQSNQYVDIEIVQQTVEDGLVYKTVCKLPPLDATLEVAVSNLPQGQRLRLRTANNLGYAFDDGPVTLEVRAGQTELFGTLSDIDDNVLRLFRSSIEVAGTTNLSIDVNADGAAPDMSGTFTLSPNEDTATIRTSVIRPYAAVSLTGVGNVIGTSRNYLMLPAPLRQPDDLYRFTVAGSTGVASRTAKKPGALAFTLPAQLTAPAPELLRTPFLHPAWKFDPTAPVLANQFYVLDANNFSQFDAVVFRDFYVAISARWLAGQTTVRYEFPDFSMLPGFAALALIDRERIDTTVTRVESSAASNVDGAESTGSSATSVLGEFCGDGTVQTPETCDPGDGTETPICDFDCTAAQCGDSVINAAAGETCDPPAANVCDAQCHAI
jgi:hypothetical protein